MDLHLGILYLFFVSSISVYAVLMSGWVSNSKYAFDGAVRGTVQMVSYEESIGLLFLSVCLCCRSLSLSEIVKVQERGLFGFPTIPNYGYVLCHPATCKHTVVGEASYFKIHWPHLQLYACKKRFGIYKLTGR